MSNSSSAQPSGRDEKPETDGLFPEGEAKPKGGRRPRVKKTENVEEPTEPMPDEAQSASAAVPDEGEKPLPSFASPPPSQPSKAQKTSSKLDLEKIRKARAQVTPSVGQVFRIPVIDSPSSSAFLRTHPTFGGLDDPMPLWKKDGLGGGGSGFRMVDPEAAEAIRAHGGKVGMYALWWAQYSIGGQFIVVSNAESDNDWIQSARLIYEAARTQWLKRINAGNCWTGLPPPVGVQIPDPSWTHSTWDEVLHLGFDEMVGTDHPEFLSLVYGGLPPTNRK
jgi:hypothetical protein